MEALHKHEQERLVGSLRPFALDRNHPPEGFFVQNIANSCRRRSQQKIFQT